jgi:hypothetical protein
LTVLHVPHSEVWVGEVRDWPDSPGAWHLEEFQVATRRSNAPPPLADCTPPPPPQPLFVPHVRARNLLSLSPNLSRSLAISLSPPAPRLSLPISLSLSLSLSLSVFPPAPTNPLTVSEAVERHGLEDPTRSCWRDLSPFGSLRSPPSSAARRYQSRERNVAKQTWNLCQLKHGWRPSPRRSRAMGLRSEKESVLVAHECASSDATFPTCQINCLIINLIY